MLLAAAAVIKYAASLSYRISTSIRSCRCWCSGLNIYTDPRIPMSMEEKVYPINSPDADSRF